MCRAGLNLVIKQNTAPYVPGHTPRPSEGQYAAIRETARAGMSVPQLVKSEAWLAGWTLFRQEYYWEAHEVWEPVWLHLPPNSAERQVVRACIQLANALLKEKMGWPKAALRLRVEVLDLLESVDPQRLGLSLDVNELISMAQDTPKESDV